MTEVREAQTVYGIYVGDFQFRTPQDQGPVQNAAFDKGIVTVANRSLYSDSSSPAYLVELLLGAYSKIPEGAKFTGIVGMGDYLDLGCDQEANMLLISLRQMMEENPELRFALMVPGNHDGGQFMGTIWSTKNFFNLTGYLYPDFILDAQIGMCGDQDQILERNESVKLLDHVVRESQDGEGPSFEDVVAHIKTGSRRGFRTPHNDRYSFKKDADEIFKDVWHPTPELDRWDAVIHYDNDILDQHHDEGSAEEEKIFRKLTEFAHMRGDVKQWIHLQARKQAEFETESGATVPVYEIALDTMDFTSNSDFAGAIKGHMSKLQISMVGNFMDRMLKENPNAKFKLAMHYPVEDLSMCARKALKRLLEREEVILVADAHVHERGFDADVREFFKLDRVTPLARLTVPSSADSPREAVLEEMSFTEDGGKARIDFKFKFEGVEEADVRGADPVVFEALEYLETQLSELKRKDFPDVESPYVYINEDEVISRYDGELARIASSGGRRSIQIREVLNIIFRLWGRASHKLTAEGSIPQMQIDFKYFLPYLDVLAGLLKLQYPEKAAELMAKIADMKAQYEAWSKSYERRREQGYPNSGVKIMNSLYTDAELDEVYDFINDEIPEGSFAKAFAVIVGKRAAEEEAKYHGYETPEVADEVRANVRFLVKTDVGFLIRPD